MACAPNHNVSLPWILLSVPIQHAFFEEVAVSTLKYLDILFQRSDMEKSQFFKKNLARVIGKLPKVRETEGSFYPEVCPYLLV